MPAKNPKIQVVLDRRWYDLIKGLSQETGQSMSGLVAEIISGMGPTLEKMLEARLLAKQLEGESLDVITKRFEAAIEDIKKAAVETLNIQ